MNRKFLVLAILAIGLVAGVSAQDFDTDTFLHTDNFEESDLSTPDYAGDTGEFSINSDSSYLGEYGLESDIGDGGYIEDRNRYMSQGQMMAGYIKVDDSQGDVGIHKTSGDDITYSVRIDTVNDDEARLVVNGDDVTDDTLDEIGSGIPNEEWIRYEWDWAENGDMEIQLYDESSGEKLGTLTEDGADEFESGFIQYGASGGGEDTYWDAPRTDNEHYMRDGDFERGYTDHIASSSDVSVTSSEYWSGENSLNVTNRDQFYKIFDVDSSNYGKLQDGETYKISYLAKNDVDDDMELGFAGCTGMGKEIIPANSDWDRYEATFTVGDGCGDTFFQIRDDVSWDGDSIYIDGVSLQRVEDDEDNYENPWEEWDLQDGARMFDGELLTAIDYPGGDGPDNFTDGTATYDISDAEYIDFSTDIAIENTVDDNADRFKILIWGGTRVIIDHYDDEVRLQDAGTELDSESFSNWELNEDINHSRDLKTHDIEVQAYRNGTTTVDFNDGDVNLSGEVDNTDEDNIALDAGVGFEGANHFWTNTEFDAKEAPEIDDSSVKVVEDDGDEHDVSEGDTVYVNDNYDIEMSADFSDVDGDLDSYEFFAVYTGDTLGTDTATGSLSGSSDSASDTIELSTDDQTADMNTEITGEDEDGLTTTEDVADFTVDYDDEAPEFDVDHSVDGQDVTISASNFSEDIDYVEFDVGGEETKTSNSEEHEVTFEDIADGKYTFEVTAYDLAGNDAKKDESVVVDTENPSIEKFEPEQTNDELEIDWEVSDNVEIDETEFYIDGELERTEEAGSGSTSDAGTFTVENLDEGEHDVEIKAYDLKDNTATDEKSIDMDLSAPELDGVDVEIVGDEDADTAKWDDEFEVSVDAEDENEIKDATVTLVAGGEKISDEETIEGDSITINPRDYYPKEKLIDIEGDVEVDVVLEDEFGNSKTFTDVETGLTMDNKVDFQRWFAPSPLDERTFNFEFWSEENITKIETDVIYRDEDPSISFEYDPEPNECNPISTWFGTCPGGEYIDVYSNEHNITVTNELDEEQILYYRDREIETLEPNGETYVYPDADWDEDADIPEDNVITTGTGNIGVGAIESRFTTDILYDEIDTDGWEREEQHGLYRYTSETSVPSTGIYTVRMDLEDSKGNNRTVEREARARPDTKSAYIYQYLYNSFKLDDLYVGLMIMFLPVLAVFFTEYPKTRRTMITSIATISWFSVLIYYGALPDSATIVAMLFTGLLVGLIMRRMTSGDG